MTIRTDRMGGLMFTPEQHRAIANALVFYQQSDEVEDSERLALSEAAKILTFQIQALSGAATVEVIEYLISSGAQGSVQIKARRKILTRSPLAS